MISLAPILSNIQATLNEKITMLKKREGSMEQSGDGHEIFVPSNEIGAPITDGNIVNENYMFARTPFFRMSSFADSTTGPVVIMGGELDFRHRMRGGFDNRAAVVNETVSSDKKVNYNGLYHQSGNMPLRPTAGVESIDIAFKGGGMRLGATRSGDIKWICHTWEDLQKFTPHFLAHGKTILVEWGWSGIGKLKDVMLYPLFTEDLAPQFIIENTKDIGEKLISHIEEQNGHYDAMFGKIKSFDWTVRDDGAFDCTTELIAPGVTLMEKKFKNLKSPLLSDLPTLATRTTDAKKYVISWFDTDAEYTSNVKEQNLAGLAPYITFKEYMRDFPNQVTEYISRNVDDLMLFNDKHVAVDMGWGKHENTLGWKSPKGWDTGTGWQTAWKKKYKDTFRGNVRNGIGEKVIVPSHMDWQEYTMNETWVDPDNTVGGDRPGHVPKKVPGPKEFVKKNDPTQVGLSVEKGRGAYITWGWFEDNVLSRFFGHIIKDQTEVLGEFRSIENYQSATGKAILGKNAGVEEDYSHRVKQSTRMYNSKYLMTVDTSKWLIPNKGDLLLNNMVQWFGDGQTILKALYETADDITIKAKASGGEVFENTKEIAKFAIAINKATQDYMPMRNILFNTQYLKSKLEDVEDLASGVQAVWDDFSSTYGGVYRFKMEMTDGGEGMMIKEEGYTQHTVKDLLDKNFLKSMGEEPAGPGLFVFPTWEAGSIVKSQNINAKLPDRMQIAAMYGTSTARSSEDEKEDRVYDEMAAIAWGQMNSPNPKMSPVEALNDYYSGDIDYPSRGNRTFGRTDAREDQNLYIQKTDTAGILQLESGADAGPGIRFYPTIYSSIEESQIEEQRQREKAFRTANPDNTAIDNSGNVNLLDASTQAALIKLAISTFDSTKGPVEDWQQLYTMNWTELSNKSGYITWKSSKSGYPSMKQEVLREIQKFFRGGDDSILDKVDPLIPIDFEMEIDGTGGMFPGNSFHSSYLSERYKEEALFQMKGVSHKLDSSGWTTTIVGQIRAKRKVEPHEKLSSGGKGKGGASSNKGGKRVGPNGEEVFQQSSGAKKFYYRDSKNVDPATGKGVIKWWKENPDVEIVNIYPKDQTNKVPTSGDETKDPAPIEYTVGGTSGEIASMLEIDNPQNNKVLGIVYGESMGTYQYTFGERFSLTASKLKKQRPELMISKMGTSHMIKFLKLFNPDKWLVWNGPGAAFAKGSTIIVGWSDEPKGDATLNQLRDSGWGPYL